MLPGAADGPRSAGLVIASTTAGPSVAYAAASASRSSDPVLARQAAIPNPVAILARCGPARSLPGSFSGGRSLPYRRWAAPRPVSLGDVLQLRDHRHPPLIISLHRPIR